MQVDVFLSSGVCVTVPDGTDPDTPEGYQAVKEAAIDKFLELLGRPSSFDIEAEIYEPESAGGEPKP